MPISFTIFQFPGLLCLRHSSIRVAGLVFFTRPSQGSRKMKSEGRALEAKAWKLHTLKKIPLVRERHRCSLDPMGGDPETRS